MLYVPSARQYHLGEAATHYFGFNDCIFAFDLTNFGGVRSTNRIPLGTSAQEYLADLKHEFIAKYPKVNFRSKPSNWFGARLQRYFGDGKITVDPASGERKVYQYLNSMGFNYPKILSIDTDGTNAVVSFDRIEEISDDRPVLTFDSYFRVVRATLNGQPLVLNSTNNIYVKSEPAEQAK